MAAGGATFFLRQQVIFPLAIGVRAQVRRLVAVVADNAHVDFASRGFVDGVKGLLLTVDALDCGLASQLPVGSRIPDVRDVLMLAVPIGFIDASDLELFHENISNEVMIGHSGMTCAVNRFRAQNLASLTGKH